MEPRILMLGPRHPYPPWRGDQLRVYHLARNLARMADVRVLCFGPGGGDLNGAIYRPVRATPAGRLIANVRHPRPTLPGQVRLFLDENMERAVAEEVELFRPDVLHVTLSRMGPYLDAGSGCHRHLDLVDSMRLNMLTRARTLKFPQAEAFRLESWLAARYEAALVAQVDSSSVVTEVDRQAPGLESAAVIPNGVEPDEFPFEEPGDRPPVVLFFGNLGYFHNVAPAQFLTTDVLDRVRRRVPGATLRLAGARPAAAVRRMARHEGVELVENPSRMVPVLHHAAVAAIPMFSGSGMKNKVLEAFCAGLPVVTNERGIAGIEGARAGVHYEVAEGADAMADAISRLLDAPDERIRLATAARELVVERFSWHRQAQSLMSLYGLA